MERLDGALGPEVAAVGDPRHVPALLRELPVAGEEDPRQLEERDPLDTGVAIPACRLDEPVLEVVAERGELGAEGLLQRDPAVAGRHQRPGVRLVEAGPDEHVLDLPPQPLVPGQLRRLRRARGQRRGHVLDPEAHDLLDEVDGARDVARAPGGHGHLELVGDVEPDRAQALRLLFDRDVQAAQPVGELGHERDARPLGQPFVHVDVTGPACAGKLDEELRRVDGSLLRRIRVDAFLPARRRLRAQPQPARRAQHGERVEVGRLEEQVGRLRAHLALLTAHDPGDRHGVRRVGDHEVRGRQLALLPVERAHLLALLRAADDDPSFCEARDVERVQRRAQREHHVVRHVDDVGDRPHARCRAAAP